MRLAPPRFSVIRFFAVTLLAVLIGGALQLFFAWRSTTAMLMPGLAYPTDSIGRFRRADGRVWVWSHGSALTWTKTTYMVPSYIAPNSPLAGNADVSYWNANLDNADPTSYPPHWRQVATHLAQAQQSPTDVVETLTAGWPFQCLVSAAHVDTPQGQATRLHVLAGTSHDSIPRYRVGMLPPGYAAIPVQPIPTTVLAIGLIGNVSFFALLGALAALTPRGIILFCRHRRSARGVCATCAYPQAYTASGPAVCPECGEIPPPLRSQKQ